MLTIAGASKRLSGGGSDFTLEIPRADFGSGQFVAIVGPNGCGKTSLLNILALLSAPDEVERFELRGERRHDLRRLSAGQAARYRRQFYGYVLQSGGLFDFLSVRANIALPAQIAGVADAAERTLRMAAKLGISDLLTRKPKSLSGGQRQRVAVARALAHRPKIVLADEPTASVDYASARAVVEELAEMSREEGACVIMVTHSPSLVAGLADRVFGFEMETVGRGTRSVLVELERGVLGGGEAG